MAILARIALAPHDLALAGGCVIDPKNGVDRIAGVAIQDGASPPWAAGLPGRSRSTFAAPW